MRADLPWRMVQQKVSRRELYELVWSMPMTKLAPRFGMSDVALRKRCHNHEIPTPGAGYWAQIAAGHTPEKAALPPADADLEHIAFERHTTPMTEAKEPVPSVAVGAELQEPHAVVTWLQGALRNAKDDQHGRAVVGYGYFPEAVLSKASWERALRIVDAFSKALEQRGHEVRAGTRGKDSHHREMLVSTFGETLSISIHEKLERTPHVLTVDERRERDRWANKGWGVWDRAPKYDYVPNGELKLCLGLTHYKYVGRKSWSDTKAQRLDDFLGHALLAIEAAARVSRHEHLEHERAQRAHRDAERKRLRAERLDWYRAQLLEELEALSAAWTKAAELQQFLTAYDKALPAEKRTPLDNKWFEAAKSYATRLDPLTRADTLAKGLEPSDEELERLIAAEKDRAEDDD